MSVGSAKEIHAPRTGVDICSVSPPAVLKMRIMVHHHLHAEYRST